MSWSVGAPGQGPENRPLPRDPRLLEAARQRVGEARLGWMLRQRNLTIFPNLQLIDIQSLQLRTWQPLAVDRTRMSSRCLAPRGESREARRFRIRQYEEFFNAGGLATSDDNVMYALNQDGLAASAAGATQGFARGMAAPPPPDGTFAALDPGAARLNASPAGLAFGDETAMHAGYREWRRLMQRNPGTRN
jgi:benzoate/toluate 1,2-dioxygenase alpha subunit/2,4,5-trichlorophenoxyacetic acid oxygenase 1